MGGLLAPRMGAGSGMARKGRRGFIAVGCRILPSSRRS